jgi:hypothetical protein
MSKTTLQSSRPIMRTILRLLYSRRKTNRVATTQHTTPATIIRYPTESGCSKFGSTPGGGGIAPETSASIKNNRPSRASPNMKTICFYSERRAELLYWQCVVGQEQGRVEGERHGGMNLGGLSWLLGYSCCRHLPNFTNSTSSYANTWRQSVKHSFHFSLPQELVLKYVRCCFVMAVDG